MTKLEWNVYIYNINKRDFEVYNIFDHYSYFRDINKILKSFKKENDEKKEEFEEKIKRETMYYFWSKSEWEVVLTPNENNYILTPWVGRSDAFLEVNDTEHFNWEVFYKEITNKKYGNPSVKIDVYDQVKHNWEKYIDYLWSVRTDRIRRHKYDT